MNIKNANWLFVTALLFAVACKKNDAPSIANDAMRTTVISWLDKQQTPDQAKRMAIAKGIKDNLQWDRAWEAKHDKDETLLMIPIGRGYKFMNNRDKEVDNYLVLFKNNHGAIRSAHIFQSLRGSTFTQKTIPGYYNSVPEDMNGTYWILALHDIIYSELHYQNNRQIASGMPQTKPATNNRSGSEVNCVDWYWVYTTYDPETGWIFSQTETYLGTSCTGCLPNTNQPQTTITAETEWDCMAGTGGDPEEVEIAKEKGWHAFYGDVYGIRVTVWATDRLRGKRRSSEPQGGHFTKITFQGLGCNTSGISYDYTYQHAECSNQTASSRVITRVTRNSMPYKSDDRRKDYSFAEVFNN